MNSAAIDLETFIRSELGSHDRGGRRIIGGPAIAIDPRATAVLAPVLHEIAPEAATCNGAGTDSGFAVAWSCDHQGRCVIELIDPAMPYAGSSGDGHGLHSSRQRSTLERSGDGMIRCEMSDRGARIIVPARYIANWRATEVRPNRYDDRSADPLNGRSVLVVEDQLLIALDLEALLLDEGAAAVQLCGFAEDALRSIRLERPDVAILDVNLGNATSFPVAVELQRLGIPLIFATGYGNEVEFPPGLRSIPLVAKPYSIKTIREALFSASVMHA